MHTNASLFAIGVNSPCVLPEVAERHGWRESRKQVHSTRFSEPSSPGLRQAQIDDEHVATAETTPAEETKSELMKPALVTHINDRWSD